MNTKSYIDALGVPFIDTYQDGQLIKRKIVYDDRVEQWLKDGDRWKLYTTWMDFPSLQIMDCAPPEPSQTPPNNNPHTEYSQ